MSGKGVFDYGNGRKYKGTFYQNEKHGQGTMNYANGTRYDGPWRHNVPHGEGGCFKDKSGKKCYDQWHKGKRMVGLIKGAKNMMSPFNSPKNKKNKEKVKKA